MRSARGVLAAAVVLVSASAAARAADLPSIVAPVSVFSWTGFYLGVNAGYSFDDATRFTLSNGTGITATNTGIGTARPAEFKNNADGFIAGGQFGANYQFKSGSFGGRGGVVIGFEADAAYLDNTRTGIYDGTESSVSAFRSSTGLLGTFRGRLGYAFDRFLLYGTGGVAYGNAFQKAELFTPGDTTQIRYYGSNATLQTGYVYGGGIEYALPATSFLNFLNSKAVTIRVEYLHYDLGTVSFIASNLIAQTTYNLRAKTDGDLARVGLNYKF